MELGYSSSNCTKILKTLRFCKANNAIFASVLAYLGEIISIGVAICWTIGSLWSEYSSKRLGASVMNLWRMAFSVLMYAVMCWLFLGRPWPVYAGAGTWGLLAFSGFIGFFLGDLCLLRSYVLIGARTTQLFQTLAPASAALFGWILMGQQLGWKSLIAMGITLIGIGITVLGQGEKHEVRLQIPLKGVFLGIAAAVCQGFGLVISGIALSRYMTEIPADVVESVAPVIPFSANMIRCISGFLAALFMMLVMGRMQEVAAATRDRKSMLSLIIVVIFGPVVGVGFSLMALRYTAAGIASTLQALTPILLILPSHWMFGEKLSWRSLAGAIISVAGVSLFFLL